MTLGCFKGHSESEIENAVVAYAQSRGFRAIKMRDVVNGCPRRLFISADGKFLFMEFKTQHAGLTHDQTEYIRALKEDHSCRVEVVREVYKGVELIDELIIGV